MGNGIEILRQGFRPGGHQEPLETLRRYHLTAVRHRKGEIDVVRLNALILVKVVGIPVGRSRDLIKAVFIELPVGIDARRLPWLLRHPEASPVEPVRQQNALGEIRVEALASEPGVVTEHPCARAMLLHLIGKEIHVVPIKISLADDFEIVIVLQPHVGLFIHSYVEQTGIAEYLRDIPDNVGARLVVT